MHGQPDERRRDVITLRLGAAATRQAIDRQARGEVGGNDVVGAVLLDHCRYTQHRIVAQPYTVLGGGARFRAVVGLVLELRPKASQQGRHIQGCRHQAGRARQQPEVGHVAGDAVAHARILDLQGQHAAVVSLGAVHLPDRCCSHRLVAQAAKTPVPAMAVFALEYLGQLRRRHHMGLLAQAAQQFGEMRWQHAAAVHRHQLTDLHHGAAHLRQPLGKPMRVARAQHQLRQFGALAARQLAQALGGGARGHLSHRAAEVPQPSSASFGHGRAARQGGRVRHGGIGHGMPRFDQRAARQARPGASGLTTPSMKRGALAVAAGGVPRSVTAASADRAQNDSQSSVPVLT